MDIAKSHWRLYRRKSAEHIFSHDAIACDFRAQLEVKYHTLIQRFTSSIAYQKQNSGDFQVATRPGHQSRLQDYQNELLSLLVTG